MENIVFIYPTQVRAEEKFREMLEFLGDKINRSFFTPLAY